MFSTGLRTDAPVFARTRYLMAVLWLACCSLPSMSHATPITAAQAVHVVQHWLALDPMPLGAALCHQVAGVSAYGTGATACYYAVALSPTGYVIVAGDDLLEPIIAFVPTGHYDPSPANPLGALVSRDVPHCLALARVMRATTAQAGTAQNAVTGISRKWAVLLGTQAADGLASLSDPRVDPLLKMAWDEGTANNDGRTACFNYYTPPYTTPGNPNNDICGCGATALAMFMRYWQYPTNGVGTASFPIQIVGVPATGRLRGGDGNGGPYQWANMPLNPTSGATTAQCQAIGALCADAGVALEMDYSHCGSISSSYYVAPALTSVFKFSNVIAVYHSNQDLTASLPAMVNPNLDAGFPVLFGISSITDNTAHQIVCDGYGYDGATIYHHLNMGWSGDGNAWYHLPTVDTYYAFDKVFSCIYNVFPTGHGEMISGRVLDEHGAPVAGAVVTAVGQNTTYPSVTTNARGIYAFAKMPSNTIYLLKATAAGMPMNFIHVNTGASVSDAITTGNVWGADIHLTRQAPALTLIKSCGQTGAFPGSTLTYTLCYGNSGNGTATNIRLTDVLPAYVNYVANSAGGGGKFANGTLTWSVTSLGGNQSGSVSFQVTVASNAPPNSYLSNTAGISSAEISTPVSSNTVSVYIETSRHSEWWMFHHDPLHTGRSAFTGPVLPMLKWQFSAANQIWSSPVIGADGTLYVGSLDDALYALDPASGTLRWKYTTGGIISASPVIGTNGTIYVGSGDSYLYALNPDGSLQWKYALGGPIWSSPVIGADGTIFLGSCDRNLYALNSNGTLQWKYATGNQIWSSPALGADGTIYFGSADHYLYALTPAHGTLKWKSDLGGTIESSPAIGTDGTIYVGSDNHNLYALKPADGAVQWKYATGQMVYSSPALGADGTIYVGSCDNNLYALRSDGSLKWRYTTGDQIWGSPAIGADGTIYVGSDDHNLYALKPADGTLQWQFTTGNEIFTSSPAIGPDGTIYFGGCDYNCYAIGPGSPPYFTLTPQAGGNGTVSPALPQQIIAGGNFTYAATPSHGYQVNAWSVDGTSTQVGGGAFTLENVTADHAVLVTFTPVIIAQPDLTICNATDKVYLGAGSYNTDGTKQTVRQTTAAGAMVNYFFQVTNAGTTGDSFLLTAPKLAAGWKTQYVDWSTGKDITASVTGSGWKTVVVKPGASLGYTLHLTPDGTVPALPASLPITAVSTLDGAKKDTVKATTTVSPRYQPDLAICNYGETGYLGLGVCNTGGANQTKNQTIPAGKMVTYLFEVKNAGNTADTFTVHCALPAASGWKVQWVDRASGKDITGAVIANGSLTAPIPAGVAALYTLHVTPSAAATTTPYPLLITATSSRDQTKSDAVKAVTTKQ